MLPPKILANNKTKKQAKINNLKVKNLIGHEDFLRRLAYKDTTIKTGEAFFNDSDMKLDYYLIIVYNKKLNIPLLSARYYFDRKLITKTISIESNKNIKQNYLNKEFDLNSFNEGELFLADRLSGNVHNTIYRQHRDYIVSSLYSEIFSNNKGSSFMLMARKEKNDKLQKKYLNLGFHIIGLKTHNEKGHWIMIKDLKKI